MSCAAGCDIRILTLISGPAPLAWGQGGKAAALMIGFQPGERLSVPRVRRRDTARGSERMC
jgi:hypothetical protein